MISKIAIINSEIYAKAILKLDIQEGVRCVQLVAENNVGKSSLINTLNFLFILDGRNMKFGGDYDFKTSVKHYFPVPNHSFVVFEIYKPKIGYFCILIKRSLNAHGQIEYYLIENQFEEQHFFEKKNNQSTPFDFNTILNHYTINNITAKKIEKRELYNFVYTRNTKKPCVVWLSDRTKRHGSTNTNNFNRIYRYLINTNLITDDRLKEAIITANNKQNEKVSFADSSKEDLLKIEKLSAEIKKYKKIRNEEYDTFKNVVLDYKKQYLFLGKILYNFNFRYEPEIKKLRENIAEIDGKKERLKTEIQQIENQQSNLNQKQGELQSDRKSIILRIKELESILKEIANLEIENQFNPFDYEINRLNDKLKALERQLDDIKRFDYTESSLKKEVNTLKGKCQRLKNQITQYDNLLVQHISRDKKTQQILNNIFSPEILNQSKEKIIKNIANISSQLQIFDGIIDITDISEKPLETISELKEELKIEKIRLADTQKTLETLQRYNEQQKEVSNIKNSIEIIKKKQSLLNEKQDYEFTISQHQKELKVLDTKIFEKEGELKLVRGDLKQKRNLASELDTSYIGYKGRITRFQNFNERFKSYPVLPVNDFIAETTIQRCAETLDKRERTLQELKSKQDKLFNNFKLLLDSNISDVNEFIRSVDEEISLITQKEKNINTHLQNISNQFTGAVKNFLNSYQEFKTFKNSFNKQIGNYRISDISKIRIKLLDTDTELKRLEQISQIKSLQLNEINFQTPLINHSDAFSKNLEVLKKYIDDNKIVNFKELFDLQLVIEKRGKEKTVNIGKQVESEGTDRMIKLILFLSIIKHLVVKNEDNKIAIYIDELGKIGQRNVKEIVNFCEKNNFIPIFAAPRPIEGIDKYYIIKPSTHNQKIVVDESRAQRAKRIVR